MKFASNLSNVTKWKSHFKICDLGLGIKHYVKSVQIRKFILVRIFLYLDWKEENADQKKLRIWTLFMQWNSFSMTSDKICNLIKFQILFECQSKRYIKGALSRFPFIFRQTASHCKKKKSFLLRISSVNVTKSLMENFNFLSSAIKIRIRAKFNFQMISDFWVMTRWSVDNVCKPLALSGEWMSLCLQFFAAKIVDNFFDNPVLFNYFFFLSMSWPYLLKRGTTWNYLKTPRNFLKPPETSHVIVLFT